MDNNFDIIVVGAGHAGIEASVSAARMGCKVALITMAFDTMGRPSCNPSIGGTAKGHLVKEIDALGGVMGGLADKGGIHFKMLNISKGPAIWSPRCQIDKDLYPTYVKELLFKESNLTLVQGSVQEIKLDGSRVKSVITKDNQEIKCKAVILCAGTFLNGVMHTGEQQVIGGRVGEPAADKVSDLLAAVGLEKGRLKTGTPPRIHFDSIDFTKTRIEPGDSYPIPFSYRNREVRNSIVCYHTETNSNTHEILKEGFERSPMFQGRIKGAGPRYCPSIEDKISRFEERDSHKVLLEPEGLNTKSVYVNGFSTSLPIDIQERGLRSIQGLENSKVLKWGYAVEYDFFYPYQLKFTLETKAIDGLFFAGQINGTSGYEEAASQGLIAGINAAAQIKEEQPLILKRSEAYIGVLIDDLVNKNTEEPYRIFTSLAEYRLLLRQDNAYSRLMKYGNQYGLISSKDYQQVQDYDKKIELGVELTKKVKIEPSSANEYLVSVKESPIERKTDTYSLLKRADVKSERLFEILKDEYQELLPYLYNPKLSNTLDIEIKYEGYIERQKREIKLFLENENKMLSKDFDYEKINSLSREAREKLMKIRPNSLGQASRIPGVSASDVSILSLYLSNVPRGTVAK
jgi:tRNA uridine 5-carboxymethylaminomethyl modification enzyme